MPSHHALMTEGAPALISSGAVRWDLLGWMDDHRPYYWPFVVTLGPEKTELGNYPPCFAITVKERRRLFTSRQLSVSSVGPTSKCGPRRPTNRSIKIYARNAQATGFPRQREPVSGPASIDPSTTQMTTPPGADRIRSTLPARRR